MRRVLHFDRIESLCDRALESTGRRTGPISVEWDISGKCIKPVPIELLGRSEDGSKVLYIDIWTRCRRCTKCLQRRMYDWQDRARFETLMASRTWFGTLTFDAGEQYLAEARAQSREDSQGVYWSELTGLQQFSAHVREHSAELTKWLKRVRKQSGSSYRYLLVAEAHKSGWPHFHCLIHERAGFLPISWRTLNGQWKPGFSQFKLVENLDQAVYLCKYLSKSLLARVRASKGYGRMTDFPIGEVRDVKTSTPQAKLGD